MSYLAYQIHLGLNLNKVLQPLHLKNIYCKKYVPGVPIVMSYPDHTFPKSEDPPKLP